MISRQQRTNGRFRSKSGTRSDDKSKDAININTSSSSTSRSRGRSFSISSRTSFRSRSNSTTRSDGKSTCTSNTASRKKKVSSSKAQLSSLRKGDVVVTTNSPFKRVPLKRTSSESTTSSTGVTSKTSITVHNDLLKEKDNSQTQSMGNQRFEHDKEVDFFTDPTVLSRLIHNQKFSAAISRLEKEGPEEATVWVCTKQTLPPSLDSTEIKRNTTDAPPTTTTKLRKGSPSKRANHGKPNNSTNAGSTTSTGSNTENEFTFRQLPIHMACGSLFRVEDLSLRQDLEQLIARLVIAYPEGCARRDHQGRFPLHECIWYNAAPTIVSALLMAAPEIARMGDLQGVTPTMLNEHRNCPNSAHKKMVRGMLKKSSEFWRTARKEAELRMKHREIPSAEATIGSTSVLASSAVDDETISSSSPDKRKQQNQKEEPQPALQVPVVKPLEWSQLEERVVALEHKLSASYEYIYVLNQQLNEVKGAKNALQTKFDKFANSDLGKRVVALENERDELQFHLARSQAVLAKYGISLEEENIAEGMPPLPPIHISFGSRASTEDTAANTSTSDEHDIDLFAEAEQNIRLDADVSHIDGQSELDKAVKLKKASLFEQQMNVFNRDKTEYEERTQILSEIMPDDATAKSEITTDDFTAMTPVSRVRPKRPEPETTFGGIGGSGKTRNTKKTMTAVVEDRVLSGPGELLNTPGNLKDIQKVKDSSVHEPKCNKRINPASGCSSGHSVSSKGRGTVDSSDHTYELDSVIAGAMELNGGHGLSPDMVKLWKSTRVGSSHGTRNRSTPTSSPKSGKPKVHNQNKKNKNDICGTKKITKPDSDEKPSSPVSPRSHPEVDFEYTDEERMMMAMVTSRPGADDSSLVPPPQQQRLLL